MPKKRARTLDPGEGKASPKSKSNHESKSGPKSNGRASPRRRASSTPTRRSVKRKRSSTDGAPSRVSARLSGKSTRKVRARRSSSDRDFGSPGLSASVANWSSKQIAAITKAVGKFAPCTPMRWKNIAAAVPGKTQQECKAYWTAHEKSSKRRRKPRRKEGSEELNPSSAATVDPLWNKFVKPIVAELTKARLPKALLAAYEGEGWKRSNHEKVRPEKELNGARQKILKIKAKIRGLLQELAHGEGAQKEKPIEKSGDGSDIDASDILCAVCGQGDDEGEDNDIVLCDLEGCNRAFHQKCVEPHITMEELGQADDWFCRRCNCKLNCLNAINDEFEADYDDVDEVFKADLERAEQTSTTVVRGAWDTHSFSSNSDSEYETQENDKEGSDDEDDTQSESGEEEKLVLNYKRPRKRVDYVKLAQELGEELDDDRSDADFSIASSKLDANATLKSAFA